MAQWAKFKFFFDTMLGSASSTLTAGSTASGDYSAAYLYNMLETNLWKAADTTSPVYITYDAGAGNTKQADYMGIAGHNFNTIGATVELQSSSDNFAADVTSVLSPFAPSTDKALVKEFTLSAAKRYYRLRISGTLSAAPYMALAIWGLKTELDWATASFDPYEEEVKAAVLLSQGGYVTGVHTEYSERTLALVIEDADSALYAKVKDWWDRSGLKNLFVAWDITNNPNDAWLMRPDTRFSNPFKGGGIYRDITINLRGRKE